MRAAYYVEGWRNHVCIGFAYVATASTAVRRGKSYQIALSADQVVIRRLEPTAGAVAQMNGNGHWTLGLEDPRIRAALHAAGEVDEVTA